MKQLNILADQLSEVTLFGNPDVEISSISSDSRKIQPGALFAAISGHRVEGSSFVESAIQAGAVAVLTEQPLDASIPQLVVPNVRDAMAILAPYIYDFPSSKMRMIGVTGTNGKTTTSFLIHHLLKSAGKKVGLIGTICSLIGDKVIESTNTTPDIADLQELLHQMLEAGSDTVIMEVSSHALALNRTAGCEFDVGIFTNLTQDHLDFHHTLEEYCDAKKKLFVSLGEGKKGNKRGIINQDDPSMENFQSATKVPVWTYGYKQGADFQVVKAEISQEGTSISLKTPDGEKELKSSLVGDFNVYNILAAVSAVRSEGMSWEAIEKGLASFSGVSGRFQQITNGKNMPLVVVDYAHTPDGLKNVLETARKLTQGKLITVFGCGGDRDRTKRPLMGKIGADLADQVILTSDNPRSEEPMAILQDILTAWESNVEKPEAIADRKEAIEKAIQLANPRDVVLISGKGHETYQILKDEVIHFDDREVACAALEAKYGKI